jgi:hypothetical protein
LKLEELIPRSREKVACKNAGKNAGKKRTDAEILALGRKFQQTYKPSIRVKGKTLTAKLAEAKKGREDREEDPPLMHSNRPAPVLWCLIFVFAAFLTGCSGVSKNSSTTATTSSAHQFTHVYVVFPPQTDPNKTHFMSTVMTQAAIEGVTVATSWRDAEITTPGPGTCSPVGTEFCQQDAFGWTHSYDWSTIDANNEVWFGAESGSKKVNIILDGIGGASPLCAITNTCINPITPYYVTTSSWAAHTASGLQDIINGNKDSCTNDVGLDTTSMIRDSSGMVTVTENNHGYVDGDTIWVGGTIPSDFNVTTPAGVHVENATANSFQYQSSTHTAGTASAPGTVISRQQSYPVPYETPYKTAWKAFVAAAVLHFNNSKNFSQIDYMRVGRSVGGEAYPYCIPNMQALPSPNTYSKSGWLAYYTEIDDFVQAQKPKMQILDPLNAAGTGTAGDPKDFSYGTEEAAIAIAHSNASGVVNGFGSQGLQASDISNYASNTFCASDWCGTFNANYQTNNNLELQTESLSAPVALSDVNSPTGDLRPLLPFGVERHMTIFELYNLDALLAYDPNYCVINSPDNGLCGPGSVEIPIIVLPADAQQPYFQAVGQPGQSGAAKGDGSYAAVIKSTEGQH